MSALVGCSEGCTYCAGPDGDKSTGIIGIKFDTGYEGGESRIVSFTLRGCGDYYEKPLNVSTKESTVNYGWVTGPTGLAADPCAPVPELPTIVLLSVGLLVLAGYVRVRLRRKGGGVKGLK